MLKDYKKYQREHDRLCNKTLRNSKKIYDNDGNWIIPKELKWTKWFRKSSNKIAHVERYLNQSIGKNIDIIHSYLSSIGLLTEFDRLINKRYSGVYIENNILCKYPKKPRYKSTFNPNKTVYLVDCNLCRVSIKKNDIYIQYFSDKILNFNTKEIEISNNITEIVFNGNIDELDYNSNNSLKNNKLLAIKLKDIYHNYKSFKHLFNDIRQYTRNISDLEIKQFLLNNTDFHE